MFESERTLLTNYQYLVNRMKELRLEVEDMDDAYLIEEVVDIDYGICPSADQVIGEYFNGKELTDEDREILVNYYVLAWVDEDFEE